MMMISDATSEGRGRERMTFGGVPLSALVLATALALPACGIALGQENAQAIPIEAIKWVPIAPVLPEGGQMAVLSGDPGKAGPFTVRLKMPAGYRIPAHQHPHSEPVTVISGEFIFAVGNKLDEGSAQKLGPGGFVDLPANVNHSVFAAVETVVQITAEGPLGITYANPADDPSKTP